MGLCVSATDRCGTGVGGEWLFMFLGLAGRDDAEMGGAVGLCSGSVNS